MAIQSENQEGDMNVLKNKLREEVEQLNIINRDIEKYHDDIENLK